MWNLTKGVWGNLDSAERVFTLIVGVPLIAYLLSRSANIFCLLHPVGIPLFAVYQIIKGARRQEAGRVILGAGILALTMTLYCCTAAVSLAFFFGGNR